MASLKYQIQSIQNKSSHLPITHYPPPLILPQRRVQTLTQLAKPETQILDSCSPTTFGATSSHAYTIQFSRSVVSDSLRPHGLQYARLPCPSPTPGACSNSCPSSQWCHPTISSSGILFSSCLQSSQASGSLPMSQFFPSGGQSIGVSASASVLPMNIQDWFPLGWTGWISLQSKGLL